MMQKWYKAKVIAILSETEGVKRFWLEIEDVESFDFKAGQFITFDLPIGQKRLEKWRSYSIANAPNGSNIIELCISRSLAGEGTKYLFDDIKAGSYLTFKGPDGNFVLPSAIDDDLVLICTGTGIVPFRSMLWDIYQKSMTTRKIHLIFGTRNANSILYRAEMEALQRVLPNFSYDVALSREINPNTFNGYIHPIYLEKYREVRPNIKFYICGWSNMIDEAVANLIITLGYDRKQVIYELYG